MSSPPLSQFSNKELRVLMKQNGMNINVYDKRTESYTEMTKAEKCRLLLAKAPTQTPGGDDSGL